MRIHATIAALTIATLLPTAAFACAMRYIEPAPEPIEVDPDLVAEVEDPNAEAADANVEAVIAEPKAVTESSNLASLLDGIDSILLEDEGPASSPEAAPMIADRKIEEPIESKKEADHRDVRPARISESEATPATLKGS